THPLALTLRRLVCPPGHAAEDVTGLLVGAAVRMVSREVLQEPLGALPLRRRKVLAESGFVHLGEQLEKAAAELSVDLIGRRPGRLGRLLLRRRSRLGEIAGPGRVRGAARVRA